MFLAILTNTLKSLYFGDTISFPSRAEFFIVKVLDFRRLYAIINKAIGVGAVCLNGKMVHSIRSRRCAGTKSKSAASLRCSLNPRVMETVGFLIAANYRH